MDDDDDGVLEAARAIRPYLIDLAGPATTGTLDHRIIDEFVGPSDPEATPGRLRALLEEVEDTARFLIRVRADKPLHRPPYYQPTDQRGEIGSCIRVDRMGLGCTRIHPFWAAAVFYPNFYPNR